MELEQDMRMTEDNWFAYKYPRAAHTTDAVVFGFDEQENQIKVLLIKRGIEPYKGEWALPGGFLRMDESLQDCIRRELQEETTLQVETVVEIGTFSGINRDPRGRVITTAFYALVKPSQVVGGDDASEAKWFAFNELPNLAFDHAQLIQCAQEKLKDDLLSKPVGFVLLPEKFTMPQLQRVYELISGKTFDRRNFAKKMISQNIVQPLDEVQESVNHRPALLFSCGEFNDDQDRWTKLPLK